MAPPLNINQWVNGQPTSSGFEGNVHVVEFWATWCGPCRVSMPHLSELQESYVDQVTIIGITNEDVGTVEGFLASESPDGRPWSDVIQYHLATDNGDATNVAYMKAAKQNGIPTAFIVGRNGTIEWIGHPGRIDDPLRQVIDGTWNQAAAAEQLNQQQRLAEAQSQLNEMAKRGDWDGALAMLDELEGNQKPSPLLFASRLAILKAAGRGEEVASVRRQTVDAAWGDADWLNSIAWSIAIGKEDRDLELALKAANRAAELTENKNGQILDTVARVHYEQGDLATAIEWQRQAVELSPSHPQIVKAMEKYLGEQISLAQPKDTGGEES